MSEVFEELESELRAWGTSEDSIQCVEDGLVEGGYVQGLDDVSVLEMLFVDESDPLSELPPEFAHFVDGFLYYLFDPQEGCLRPSELTAAFENLSIEGEDFGYSSYGDDPTLDALYDGCSAGSLADCDMLFLVADFGSEYENMAVTCGGLTEEIDVTATCMAALQDFSEAGDLGAQCEGGFYIACDAYFVVTVVGSEEEELAASCGGIREPNLTTPCWITYGFGSAPTNTTASEATTTTLGVNDRRQPLVDAAEAAGWIKYEDPLGWSIWLPPEWSVETTSSQVFFSEPDIGVIAIGAALDAAPGDQGSFDYLIGSLVFAAEVNGVLKELDESAQFFWLDSNQNGAEDLLDISSVEAQFALDAEGNPLSDDVVSPTFWYGYYDPDARPAFGYIFITVGTNPELFVVADDIILTFEPAAGYQD